MSEKPLYDWHVTYVPLGRPHQSEGMIVRAPKMPDTPIATLAAQQGYIHGGEDGVLSIERLPQEAATRRKGATMGIADTIIRREWPSVAADLADGVSVDTVRERAAETFDGEEYGRFSALLEVREEQQHVTVVIDPHDSDGVYVFEESEDAERFMAAKDNEDAYTSDEPVFAGEGAAELLRAAERDEAGAMGASDGLGV